jgi:hypothetical protein
MIVMPKGSAGRRDDAPPIAPVAVHPYDSNLRITAAAIRLDKTRSADNGLIPVVMTTAREDRHGSTIRPDAWVKRLASFRANPVMQWAHISWIPTVGNALNLQQDGDRWVADLKFATDSWKTFGGANLPMLLESLMNDDMLRAVSPGFMPHAFVKRIAADMPQFLDPENVEYTDVELMEISPCNVPSGREALQRALQRNAVTDSGLTALIQLGILPGVFDDAPIFLATRNAEPSRRATEDRMKITVNKAGVDHATALTESGKVDKDSDWSISADDENKLLGDPANWIDYAKWFLGKDDSANAETKAAFKYPFGKDGKVFRSAVIAAKQRAAQQKQSDIEDAAGKLLESIDKSERSVRGTKRRDAATSCPCCTDGAACECTTRADDGTCSCHADCPNCVEEECAGSKARSAKSPAARIAALRAGVRVARESLRDFCYVDPCYQVQECCSVCGMLASIGCDCDDEVAPEVATLEQQTLSDLIDITSEQLATALSGWEGSQHSELRRHCAMLVMDCMWRVDRLLIMADFWYPDMTYSNPADVSTEEMRKYVAWAKDPANRAALGVRARAADDEPEPTTPEESLAQLNSSTKTLMKLWNASDKADDDKTTVMSALDDAEDRIDEAVAELQADVPVDKSGRTAAPRRTRAGKEFSAKNKDKIQGVADRAKAVVDHASAIMDDCKRMIEGDATPDDDPVDANRSVGEFIQVVSGPASPGSGDGAGQLIQVAATDDAAAGAANRSTSRNQRDLYGTDVLPLRRTAT